MSKRKSSTMPLSVKRDDMVFEDDDEMDDQQTESSTADSSKGSISRVSGRAKKAKAIYDPSEYNGPVHKRKKEAMEAERTSKLTPPKTMPTQKPAEAPPRAVATTPVKVVPTVAPIVVTPEKKVKTPVKAMIQKTVSMITMKKRVQLKKPTANQTPIVNAPIEEPAAPLVPAVKEPSKRIQARKQFKPQDSEYVFTEVKKNRRNSNVSSTAGGRSDDYEKASTIELKITQVPDVRKWSSERVFDYFTNHLGFSTRDCSVFNEEEIDGETLMIMKRSDIVTTKFEKLKLGTALKMWGHIIMFQTGSNDPTQAWK